MHYTYNRHVMTFHDISMTPLGTVKITGGITTVSWELMHC